MNSDQKALMQRWEGFLGKIDGRLGEIIAEVAQGIAALGQSHGADTMPLTNAMSGLDHRVRQLREKIGETWDGQVEGQFSSHDSGGFLDAGLDRKRDFEIAFDEKWELAKTKAVADYFRALWPRAQQALAAPVGCTRCGAQLALPVRHKSSTATCASCGTVNQCIPDAVIQAYFGQGVQAFAEEASAPIRYQIERFREEVDRWRRARDWAPETLETLERWQGMERSYWETQATTRAQMLQEPADRAFVETRMDQFRKYSLESEQVWVRAHGRQG